MQLVPLIQYRSQAGESSRPGAAWKACTAWNKVFAPAAREAAKPLQDPADTDANFHDGWQPIRLRQPVQETE
jgi:hypothetical protein